MEINERSGENFNDNLMSKVPLVTLMFWIIKIFATTLGETLGDTLTKPLNDGGLDLSRIASSIVILVVMVIMIYFTYRKKQSPPISNEPLPV